MNKLVLQELVSYSNIFSQTINHIDMDWQIHLIFYLIMSFDPLALKLRVILLYFWQFHSVIHILLYFSIALIY